MKIVMLCEFYSESVQFQENLLVKYYVKHNHEVTVITSTFESVFDYYNDRHNSKLPAREYYDNGAKIIKLKFAVNISKIKRYTSIYSILEREKPDLIYVHDIMLNFPEAIRYVKRHPGTKMIMDYHADYSNSANNWLSLNILHKVIRKYYLDRARKYLSRIFPVVPASQVFLNEVYKVPDEEMEILPLGADTDLGAAIKSRKDGMMIRKKYNIPDDHKVIFTGGKLQPFKRTHMLIEAFLQLNQEDLHLLVIGKSNVQDEAYYESLKKMAEGNDRIHFVGWLEGNEVYKYLDAADLAVFPAGQSIVWQQAISMGLPLVVGNVGHQSIAYLNEFNSIVILEKDDITVTNLHREIGRIMNDPEVYNSMKAGAEKTTDKNLNWDKLIQRTLQYNEQ